MLRECFSQRPNHPSKSWRDASSLSSSESGAVVVEFAFVATPFFMIVCAILQFAYIVWAAANLDHTVQHAARLLMTGSFQNNNLGQTDTKALLAKLREGMCGTGTAAIPTIFRCSDMKLNIATSASFAGGKSTSAYDPVTKSMNTSFEGYVCPHPGEIVILTAAVSMPTFFGKFVPGAWTLEDGSFLLQSTHVFRAEPYQTVNSSAC